MVYINNKNIYKIFEECGLMMIGDNANYNNYLLPEKKDLISTFNSESDFENFTEEYKLDTILSFLSKQNHFRIIDWQFFFTNPDIFTVNEKMMLGSILISFKIHYKNNELRFTSNRESNNFVKELAKNKEFIKVIFSKDTQLKAIFLPSEQVEHNIKKELVRLIGKKITELGVYEKIRVELPKLILKDLK
jgi:phosphotransferase system IIB component